ncbi:hypothetical protein DL765_009680 [Monosporascus sp. GIB2]|nr:hypothetical protein DL765_009680 [Monosporascus sp. GIB2]
MPGLSGGFISGGRGHDLSEGAQSCRLCSILWEGLTLFCDSDPKSVQWMAILTDPDLFRLQYRLGNLDWRGLRFYTNNRECPMASVFKPGDNLEPNVAYGKNMDQVTGWLRDCNGGHGRCNQRTAGYLPTRVLDVSLHDDYVFLHHPAEHENEAYVALSHCWGGAVALQTTTLSLATFQNGIQLKSFPKTFRDAVVVTRKLHCRYLWIDSLCIIQDSKEDWKQEALRMADVYGNCFLTIAAVSSRDCQGGLFYPNDERDINQVVERMMDNGVRAQVRVRPAVDHSGYFNSATFPIDPAPLFTRGWCFQENILSPRILLFTKWEIMWECRQTIGCNCQEYTKTELFNVSHLKNRFSRMSQINNKSEITAVWRDLIDTYSLKRLTYDSDVLAALAGIAQLFPDDILGRYINGLWEFTLKTHHQPFDAFLVLGLNRWAH